MDNGKEHGNHNRITCLGLGVRGDAGADVASDSDAGIPWGVVHFKPKGPECVRGLGKICLQLLSAVWYPSDTHASPILPETDMVL